MLLAGIAGGAYYLGKSSTSKPSPAPIVSQTPQPISSPTPDAGSPAPNGDAQTTNWKTYTNLAYGYSIKYSLAAEIDKEIIIRPSYIGFGKQISVSVSSINSPPCRGDCATETITKTEKVKINGLDAEKITGTKDVGQAGGYTPHQTFLRYEIFYKDNLYKIQITELPYDASDPDKYPVNRTAGEVPPDKLLIFNQMLSSFKFLK